MGYFDAVLLKNRDCFYCNKLATHLITDLGFWRKVVIFVCQEHKKVEVELYESRRKKG